MSQKLKSSNMRLEVALVLGAYFETIQNCFWENPAFWSFPEKDRDKAKHVAVSC